MNEIKFFFRETLFNVNPASIKLTAKEAKNALNLPEKNSYRLIRIYSDGTYVLNDVPSGRIYENIAYNAIYRNESALVVDGVLCYIGYDKELFPCHIRSLILNNVRLVKKRKHHIYDGCYNYA